MSTEVSEVSTQLSGEDMEGVAEELETLRTNNEKLKRLLSTIEKMNDLLTFQLSKCECSRLFDTKLNTKLNVLRNKYEELKYEIDFDVCHNNRINTEMIVIKSDEQIQHMNDSFSDQELDLFYSEENSNTFDNNCNSSEENVKNEDKTNVIYINVKDININKSYDNEMNLKDNYADIDSNNSNNNNNEKSGNEDNEDEEEYEYCCEFADSKSGLLCEKKFTNRESLLKHVMRHSGDRPWFCEWDHCHYSALQRNHLVGHMRKSHTGRFQFKCDWPGCDFKGPSRYNVKRHRIIHTGEKPYKCDWPGCDFRSPNNKIAAHKRIHTGERPYACNWVGCEARFSRPFTLRNHERTHTGEKPFVCDYPNCDYRSTQQTPLATHKRKHHSLANVTSEEVIIGENITISLSEDAV